MPNDPNRPREARIRKRVAFVFSDGQSRWFPGETVDISSGGLGFQASNTFPPLTRIELRFPGNPGQAAAIRGVVRWSQPGRPGRIGVRFNTWNPTWMSLLASTGGTRVAPGIFVPSGGVPAGGAAPAGSASTGTASTGTSPAGESEEVWHPRLSRLDCRFEAEYGTAHATPLEARVVNISAKGIGLETNRALAPGTDVWTTISLPGGGTARIEGSITWARPEKPGWTAHGVRIDEADPRFYELFLHRLGVTTGSARTTPVAPDAAVDETIVLTPIHEEI